jgi:hypothetical protein
VRENNEQQQSEILCSNHKGQHVNYYNNLDLASVFPNVKRKYHGVSQLFTTTWTEGTNHKFLQPKVDLKKNQQFFRSDSSLVHEVLWGIDSETIFFAGLHFNKFPLHWVSGYVPKLITDGDLSSFLITTQHWWIPRLVVTLQLVHVGAYIVKAC